MPRKSHPVPDVGIAPRARPDLKEAIALHKRRPAFPTAPWTLSDFLNWLAHFETEYKVVILHKTNIVYVGQKQVMQSTMTAYPRTALGAGETKICVDRMVLNDDDLYLVQRFSAQLFRLSRNLDAVLYDLSPPR